VDVVRVSPQSSGCIETLALVRAALAREIDPADAVSQLAPLLPATACDGYWRDLSGMTPLETQARS
jgi:hypothetical protein